MFDVSDWTKSVCEETNKNATVYKNRILRYFIPRTPLYVDKHVTCLAFYAPVVDRYCGIINFIQLSVDRNKKKDTRPIIFLQKSSSHKNREVQVVQMIPRITLIRYFVSSFGN